MANNSRYFQNDYFSNRKKTKYEERDEDLKQIQKKREIDEDFQNHYVDNAYDVFKGGKNAKVITKTKLRSIYNMLCDIIADESANKDDNHLLPASVNALKLFKIHMIYDAGRDDKGEVKNFLMKSHVVSYLADIGNDKEKFTLYCKYFEALVAYHRFLYPDND